MKAILSVLSWMFGASAIYYQKLALFPVVMGLNIALGSVVAIFHIFGDHEVDVSKKV